MSLRVSQQNDKAIQGVVMFWTATHFRVQKYSQRQSCWMFKWLHFYMF